MLEHFKRLLERLGSPARAKVPPRRARGRASLLPTSYLPDDPQHIGKVFARFFLCVADGLLALVLCRLRAHLLPCPYAAQRTCATPAWTPFFFIVSPIDAFDTNGKLNLRSASLYPADRRDYAFLGVVCQFQ